MTTPSRGTPAGAQTLDDPARLREIAELRLHDPDVDEIFSEVTAEAAAHFGLTEADGGSDPASMKTRSRRMSCIGVPGCRSPWP